MEIGDARYDARLDISKFKLTSARKLKQIFTQFLRKEWKYKKMTAYHHSALKAIQSNYQHPRDGVLQGRERGVKATAMLLRSVCNGM